MPVCTLPAPVSSQLVGWCPTVKVVLFVSDEHLILCRQSGQQVWNTKLVPPSPGARPLSVSWSPDGRYFAMVFSDGAYTVHQVSNGRQPSAFRSEQTDVASVAWEASDDSLDGNQSSLAAFGTLNGGLRISLYGALSIGEFALSDAASSAVYQVAVDADCKEYAAVRDSRLYVYRISDAQDHEMKHEPKRLKSILASLGYAESKSGQSVQSQISAKQSAHAVELSASLVRSCSKFSDSLRDAHKQVRDFFKAFAAKSESPSRVLLAAALYGTLDPVGVEWIRDQHEQGFKRWYKALSQSFDLLRKILIEDTLLPLEELLTVVDDLHGLRESDVTYMSEAHEVVFRLIGDLVQGNQQFELQACFLEHLFREETDRPIAVAKLAKVTLSDVVRSLADSADILGLPDVEKSESLKNLSLEIQSNLDHAVQETRESLRKQIRLSCAADVGGKVKALKRHGSLGGYRLILDSGAIVDVNGSGVVTASDGVSRFGAVFTGQNCDVLSLDVDKQELALPDGSRKPVSFRPAAAAAYFDGEVVTVCVLSEDCQHYEFLSI